MLLHTRSITARCIPHVAAAFVEPDGGRPNIAAKTLATLWYLLVLPDAQNRLHRQLHRKRVPWYAPSRLFGIALAAANIVTMPLSWGLLVAGRRNASRLAALSVLLNPPSIALSVLLVSELSTALVRKSVNVVRGTAAVVVSPFVRKPDPAASDSNAPAATDTHSQSTAKPADDKPTTSTSTSTTTTTTTTSTTTTAAAAPKAPAQQPSSGSK